MFSPLLAAGGVENSSSLWLGIMAAVAALAFLSLASLFASRYRRCPSNRVLVIFGKVGGGNTAALHPRRRGLGHAADPGLRAT